MAAASIFMARSAAIELWPPFLDWSPAVATKRRWVATALLLEVEHHGLVAAATAEPQDQAQIHHEHADRQPGDGAQCVVLRLAIGGIDGGLLVTRERGTLRRIDGRVVTQNARALGLQSFHELRAVLRVVRRHAMDHLSIQHLAN